MKNKVIKVVVIVVGFILVIALNDALTGRGGKLNPIFAFGFLAFAGVIWKWKPKSDSHELDKSEVKDE